MALAVVLDLILPLGAFAQGGAGTQADLDELQAQYSTVQQRVAAAASGPTRPSLPSWSTNWRWSAKT